MNASVAPPSRINSARPQLEHDTLYKLYIVEGISGELVAQRLNTLFPGNDDTRMSVVSYAHRQGWSKEGRADGHGRVPPPDKMLRRAKFPFGKSSAVLAELDPRDIDGSLICGPQCRWPVGKHHRTGEMHLQLFCGELTDGDLPYCGSHYSVAYPYSQKAKQNAAQD